MDKSQLPGKNKERKEKIIQIIRVDHAGEYGATRIYNGQIDALQGKTDDQTMETLEHMLSQEEDHLRKFRDKLIEYKVPETIMKPIWHVAGYAMGYLSAIVGEKTAMACTVAVEETINVHYKDQEKYLESNKDLIDGADDLLSLIHRCRMEELEHRDIGIGHDAETAPFYDIVYGVVKWSSKLAIAISKRI